MNTTAHDRAQERWLFHLAVAAEWDEAIALGVYERSTLNRALADEGFIHCSFADQVQMIGDLLYRDRHDVVLLRIDRELVDAEIRVENLDGGTNLFPHIYGPLPVSAVVRADRVPADPDGQLRLQPLIGEA